MSAKYKSPSFLLPNELNTSANTATGTGINSLYSMDFDGTEYITAGLLSEYISLSAPTSFTVSAWIKTTDNGGISKGVIGSASTSLSSGLNFTIYSGEITFGVVTSWPTSRIITTNANVNDGNWHHVVGTYDSEGDASGNTLYLYIDGTQVGSNTGNRGGYAFDNYPLFIGARGEGTNASGYFNGQIDEVAIFNRALNTTEIAALYGGTSPNIYPSNLIASNLNPVAYYPLGEQAQNSGYLDPSNPGNDMSGSEWQFPNGVLQDYVMDFDGTGYIEIPKSNALNLVNTNFSISIWLNPDISHNGLVLMNYASSKGFGVYYNSGNLRFRAYPSAWQTLTTIATQEWTHILIVGDDTGNNLLCYKNGIEVYNSSYTLSIVESTDNIYIGSENGSGFFFNGKLSNIAIWNTDQSASKDNIYNNGSPQTSYTVSPQNWWKLNADSVYTPSAPNYTTALDFVASESDYISFPDTSLTGEFTVSFWMKPDLYAAVIIGDDASQDWLRIHTSTQTDLKLANVKSSWQSGATFTTGEWQHVVLRRDSSNVCTIFRNGIHYTNNSPTKPGTFGPLNKIGQKQNGFYFDGQLSNIAIFNSALTPSQVSTLFNFGTPETAISFSTQAWWKLDDQTAITDYSGNGNTGTNNGATDATTSVAVVPSWKIPTALTIPTINYTTALNFNSASSNYINCGDVLHNDGQTPLTVSGWVKITTAAGHTSSAPLANKKKVRMAPTYIMSGWAVNFATTSAQTNRLHFELIGDTTSATGGISKKALTFSFTDGLWHHVAVTYDGSGDASGVKFYIDGLEDTNTQTLQNTFSGTLANDSTVDFQIGKVPKYGAINYMDGDLSNIQIWNTALTSSQVSTLYNSGQPETAISFSPVSWWKLDTGGSTITDYGSGGNNGTNSTPGATQITSDVFSGVIPVNGVSTTLPSTALQQSDLQFDSPYSNYSLSFDGVDDYVATENTFTYLDGGTTMTLSVWIKPITGNGSYMIAHNPRNTTAEQSQFMLWFYSGYLELSLSTRSQYVRAYSTTINMDNWNHIACVVDLSSSPKGMIYINGVDEAYEVGLTNFNAFESAAGVMRIGEEQTGYATPFLGNIDEFAIWNRNLTEAQILEVYNNGRPKNLSTFSGTAPISWWRLGENAYFNDVPAFTVPNSISGAPNVTGSGSITTMISADAPGTYANGIGTNLAILDRVGDAPLSTSNSQSYNMIPSDISPYVPQYVGDQISNIYSMSFNGTDQYINAGQVDVTGTKTISLWFKTNDVTKTQVFYHGQSVSNDNLILGFYDSKILASVSNSSGTPQNIMNVNALPLSGSFLNNTWYHIVLTKSFGDNGNNNGQITALYVNNYENKNYTGNRFNSTNQANVIGKLDNHSYFDGQLDEVAIFDTALNADQIKFDLYQPSLPAGSNKTADIAKNPNLPTPVAWYRMGD